MADDFNDAPKDLPVAMVAILGMRDGSIMLGHHGANLMSANGKLNGEIGSSKATNVGGTTM